MGQKEHKPEEIVAKRRQVDVLLSQGRRRGSAFASNSQQEILKVRSPASP